MDMTMAPQQAKKQATAARIGGAAKGLMRWREVLRFATSPSDAHLSVPSDVFMVFEGDAISFEDADGTPLDQDHLAGKTADLVLFDDSCYDLTLTLPPAPHAEFKAMISNEINFASPFREDDAHAFWRANENAAGTWDVHIGVVLKSEIARALAAAEAQGLQLRRVVRLGADEPSSIYAAPAWLTGQADTPRSTFPKALRLPAAALALFVLSVAAQIGSTALETRDLHAQAAAADQKVRQAASTLGFQRSVDKALAGAAQNVEILAMLSQHLPDDTWLDRITLEGDTVRIIGFGPSGAETVRLISALDGITNPRSIGTVTRDNTQNVERFVIEFDLLRPAQ